MGMGDLRKIKIILLFNCGGIKATGTYLHPREETDEAACGNLCRTRQPETPRPMHTGRPSVDICREIFYFLGGEARIFLNIC
jgi:hypothetical protein